MSSTTSSMDIRETGKKALGTVLNQQQNIKTFEKYLHKYTEKEVKKGEKEYDEIYKNALYQIIGDIIKGGDIKVMLKNVKKKRVGWCHPCFEEVKQKIEEHDDFIINPFEIVEGIAECKCGSKKVYTYSKQVRGGDESTTVFCFCARCPEKWTT